MTRSYANGKIYCIRNRAAGDSIVYVGSTTQALCERMSSHRRAIGHSNMKLYKLMEDVGVDQFHIELIHDFAWPLRGGTSSWRRRGGTSAS